jgi:hypothetical protein
MMLELVESKHTNKPISNQIIASHLGKAYFTSQSPNS